jgi:hypothetical protein
MTEPTVDPNQKYEVIDPDAILEIKISTGFYNRMQEVVHYLVQESNPPMKLTEVYDQISNQNITHPYAGALETMFILLKEFQEKANQEGYVSKKTREEIDAMLEERYPGAKPEVKVEDEGFIRKMTEEESDTSEEDKEEPAD